MSWSREKQELRRKICQAARQIAQAGYVAANGESYLIRRTQRVYFEDQCIYVWAILQKRHEEE